MRGGASLAESGENVLVVDRGGIGAGASGRNGGFLVHDAAFGIEEPPGRGPRLVPGARGVEMASDGPAEAAARARRRGRRVAGARAHADAVGGEQVDVAADPWLADDLEGAFLVEGGWVLDDGRRRRPRRPPAARRALRARLRGEADRPDGRAGRWSRHRSRRRALWSSRCGRWPARALPPANRGVDLPISSSRGWPFLETARVESPPHTRSSRRPGLSRRRWGRCRWILAACRAGRLGETERLALVSVRRAVRGPLPHRHVPGRLRSSRSRRRRTPSAASPSGPRASPRGLPTCRSSPPGRPQGDDAGRAARCRAGRWHRGPRRSRRALVDRDDHGAGMARRLVSGEPRGCRCGALA